MSREVFEECGIVLTESDTIEVVNPFLYNSPGLTDESCALLAVTVRSEATLTHAGAQGTERLADFVLIERDVARVILRDGRDPWGNRYPFVTWAALMCFVHGVWEPQEARVRR
jgi:ADP-ribose pyrophosphatase